MNSTKLLIFLTLISPLVLAIEEGRIGEVYTNAYIRQIHQSGTHHFKGQTNTLMNSEVRISYLKFTNLKGHLGSLVIVSGRAESSLKFIETAEDFLARGYSEVYVLDQRGQGLATRLQKHNGIHDKNYEKVHLDEAVHLTYDLAVFIGDVIAKTAKPPYSILGHITGALPVVDYLQTAENADRFFSKVILVSPLFKLKTSRFEEVFFDYLLSRVFPDDSRIPFQGKKNKLGEFKDNNRTTSERRFNLVKATNTEVPESFSENSTVRWAVQILKFQEKVMQSKSTIRTPMLILTSQGDSLLDNSESKLFCNDVRLASQCEYNELENAKHWLMFEKDSVRNLVFRKILDFVNINQ